MDYLCGDKNDNMKKLTLLFLTIVPLILLATAAGKRSSRLQPPPAPKNTETKPASRPIAISGNTFRLPAGVSLTEGGIKGHHAPGVQRYGHGCMVYLRLGLRNHTTAPMQVTLPAGLVIRSQTDRANDALVARAITLTVPAGAVRYYHLDLFALHASIRQPGPAGAYRFGPVADNYDLSALLQTLEAKSLEDVHSLAVAQDAIWEVTNGHILSVALAGKLARLP